MEPAKQCAMTKEGTHKSDSRCVGSSKPGIFEFAMIFKYIMILLPTHTGMAAALDPWHPRAQAR